MKKQFIVAALIIVGFLASAQAQENENIVVSNAWVAVLPPSQTNTAAYMTIENKTGKDIILDSVSTPIAAVSEIHQMSQDNGMMKMAMLKSLLIPAGRKVVLEQGGNHLMLINLAKPIIIGDIIPITLHFQGGYDLLVNVPAKSTLSESSQNSGMSSMKM